NGHRSTRFIAAVVSDVAQRNHLPQPGPAQQTTFLRPSPQLPIPAGMSEVSEEVLSVRTPSDVAAALRAFDDESGCVVDVELARAVAVERAADGLDDDELLLRA